MLQNVLCLSLPDTWNPFHAAISAAISQGGNRLLVTLAGDQEKMTVGYYVEELSLFL